MHGGPPRTARLGSEPDVDVDEIPVCDLADQPVRLVDRDGDRPLEPVS